MLCSASTFSGNGVGTAALATSLGEDSDSIRKVLHRLFDKKLIRRVGKAWAEPGDDGPVPE
jgi:hypothetical protein